MLISAHNNRYIYIYIYGYTLHIYVLECETKGIHQSKWMCTHFWINEFNYQLTHELPCHLSIAHCSHDL